MYSVQSGAMTVMMTTIRNVTAARLTVNPHLLRRSQTTASEVGPATSAKEKKKINIPRPTATLQREAEAGSHLCASDLQLEAFPSAHLSTLHRAQGSIGCFLIVLRVELRDTYVLGMSSPLGYTTHPK